MWPSWTVHVSGAKDAAGNAQEDYTALAEFDLDTKNPSVTTVTIDTNPVYEGDLVQVVTVTFDEVMLANGSANPAITFSTGTWTSSGDGAWSAGDTVWTETFTVTDANQEVTGVTVDVAGAKDAAGNAQEDYTAEPEFSIDTLNPTVTSVSVLDTVLTIGETTTVTIVFSQAIDPATFDASDLDFPNGVLTNLSTMNNITWTATLTPDANVV